MASESNRSSLRPSFAGGRVCTSISDGYKAPPLQNTRTHDVFESIVKGRKSWKTLKGGEIVWPPELEAALLEGLSSYQPNDSRETRLLGRFPLRNRFISDHIFNKTGVRRTAKQVGSRLQQLRDTCGGKQLMQLLSPRPPLAASSRLSHGFTYQTQSSDSDSCSDTSSSPVTPTDPLTNFHGRNDAMPPRTVISIDLLPDNAASGSSSLDQRDFTALQWEQMNGIFRPSPHPRPFHSIDPTVTFVAHSNISARSSFTVYVAGMVVFTEVTPLVPAGLAPDYIDGSLLYSTSLVPGFWARISESRDRTKYTIVQDVVQDGPESSLPLFSAVYKFNYSSVSPDYYLHSPDMSHRITSEPHVLSDLDASHAFLFPMDSMNMDIFNDIADYQFIASDPKHGWDVPSHVGVSPKPSSGYLNSDEELDVCLSPSSACFPTDLSNYVSSLIPDQM